MQPRAKHTAHRLGCAALALFQIAVLALAPAVHAFVEAEAVPGGDRIAEPGRPDSRAGHDPRYCQLCHLTSFDIDAPQGWRAPQARIGAMSFRPGNARAARPVPALPDSRAPPIV